MTDGKKKHASCASCGYDIPERICYAEDGKGGKGCPTLTRKDILGRANKAYEETQVREFARQASLQEAACYENRDQTPYIMQPSKTRMQEICEFAGRMNYKRLGLAFCMGLTKEAQVVEEILKTWGFEVVSVCCKAGKTSKTHIDIEDKDTIYRGTDESMCNPVFQASVLNEEAVDFNILLGLCVGHDSLFFKYAKALTTVLAAKDRVTGHNPLAAIYNSGSYHRKIKHPDVGK